MGCLRMCVCLCPGPWEHVITGGVGFVVGAKVGKWNAATYEVMQYEKSSIAPAAAWEKSE